MALPAARVGDLGFFHCSVPYIAGPGAVNVVIEGLPAARMGDFVGPHLMPGTPSCIPHVSAVAKGSANVFIGGLPAARFGDPFIACTAVATSAKSVFIGG